MSASNSDDAPSEQHAHAEQSEDGEARFEGAKGVCGHAVKGLSELKWENVPAPVRRYVEEQPKLSTMQFVLLLVFACPGLAVTPLLGIMGFSSISPQAGSFAAWYQSTFGATWIFSGLQSAAMSGYAAGAVKGIAQGVAALGGGLAHWFTRR